MRADEGRADEGRADESVNVLAGFSVVVSGCVVGLAWSGLVAAMEEEEEEEEVIWLLLGIFRAFCWVGGSSSAIVACGVWYRDSQTL